MAEVYHGIDLWSNNPVAIKVLFPQYASDSSQRHKFLREEESLRKINHKHVVAVLGSGSQRVSGYDLLFLVLDYVHGCTLQQLLTIRPVLSVEETLSIVLPVAEGLSEVHAHQLIHRDIKPSNVLLSAANHRVKLTDFGLTRPSDQSWTGELMGTPAYVAPEIVSITGAAGAGADIFALGIMMFRMLTGRLPFSGAGNDQQVIYHNVNTELPAPERFAPGLSNDLTGVIRWCTRKEASARPENGTELFEVLSQISSSLGQEELHYRAPSAPATSRTLWQDVAALAEKTDVTRVLQAQQDRPEKEEETLAVKTDELNAALDYEPTLISEVISPHQEDDFPDDQTFVDEPAASYRPISAQYQPRQDYASQPRQAEPDTLYPPPSQGRARPANPRLPSQAWRQKPSLTSLVLTLLLVLIGFVTAGFVGWQLASLVLNSGWFHTWTSWYST